MDSELKRDKNLWRKVQVSKCIRVILIFLGMIFMQMVAYMLYVIGYLVFHAAEGLSGGQQQLMRRLQESMTDSSSGFLIGVSALSATLCLIWCGILYWKSDWRQKEFSYRKALSGPRLLGIIGLGFGSCVVISEALTLLVFLFPKAFISYRELMSHLDVENNWLTLLYVVFIGPASEELIFRGAIMDRLKIAFPFWLANILQAALFGLYHMNVVQGVYAFCLGMLLGFIGNVTGTIFSTILTHIIFNGTSELLTKCFDGTGTYETAGTLAVLLLAIVCFKAGLDYYLAEWRKGATQAGIDGKNMVK